MFNGIMKKLEERLPSLLFYAYSSLLYYQFTRKIEEVNKNRVVLDEDTYLPIGENFRDKFNEYINSKFIGR